MKMPESRNIGRELRALLGYGRLTPWHSLNYVRSYEAAKSHIDSTGNHWASSEANPTNSWNVRFVDGYTNTTNKFNGNYVRPAVAHPTKAWLRLRKTLQDAYEDCCRGKTTSRQCQEYIPIANDDLDLLTTELIGRTYRPTTSTCFLVRYPKLREVFAAAFRDRILHHWVCMRLNPHFEQLNRSIGNVTHNCRVGFGTNSAVDGVYKAIKDVTFSYGCEAYIFKGDLVGFFMSLPQKDMCDHLIDFAKAKYHGDFKHLLLWLIKVIVMHRPEKNCVFNSNPAEWAGLSHNKSLFRTGEGRGAPIGNLTTQLFANFYMTNLDSYMVEQINELKSKGVRAAFHRFVDDFVIICSDKEALKTLIKAAETKINALKLTMHKNKRYIQPTSHGIMFVGTYIKNHRLYLSNQTLGRFRNVVISIYRHLQLPEREITSADREHILGKLNSYLGFCKQRRCYRLRRRILKPLIYSKEFQRYFWFTRNLTKVTLKKKWKTIIK